MAITPAEATTVAEIRRLCADVLAPLEESVPSAAAPLPAVMSVLPCCPCTVLFAHVVVTSFLSCDRRSAVRLVDQQVEVKLLYRRAVFQATAWLNVPRKRAGHTSAKLGQTRTSCVSCVDGKGMWLLRWNPFVNA